MPPSPSSGVLHVLHNIKRSLVLDNASSDLIHTCMEEGVSVLANNSVVELTRLEPLACSLTADC